MPELKFGNVTYSYNPDDSFQGYNFVSITKVKSYGDNVKRNKITIKHEHLAAFQTWLMNEMNREVAEKTKGDSNNPEKEDLQPF